MFQSNSSLLIATLKICVSFCAQYMTGRRDGGACEREREREGGREREREGEKERGREREREHAQESVLLNILACLDVFFLSDSFALD